MNRRRFYALTAGLGVAAIVSLALVFGVFSPGSNDVADQEAIASLSTSEVESGSAPQASVSDASVEAAGAPALAPDAVARSSGGPTEGIQVHGHWTIEVRDPDGSLVSRREFDNALFAGNAFILAEFLGRKKTVGKWHIVASDGLGGNDPCLGQGDSPSWCHIVESSSTFNANFAFKTLTVDVPSSGSNAGKLVLAGTATAQRDGKISQVETITYRCDPSTAPATSCDSGTQWVITRTSLGSPVNVTTNQQIAVTVVISFS